MNKRIIIFSFILIIGAVAGVFGYLSSKITNFDECYETGKTGWLVHKISFYDSFGLAPNKTECVLWSGKTFYQYEALESNNIDNIALVPTLTPQPSVSVSPTPSLTITPTISPSLKPKPVVSLTPTPTPKISEEYLAPQAQAEPERFVISLDATKDEIIDKLFTEGFIKSKDAFGIALTSTKEGDNPIESGGYKIAKNMNAWEIAKILTVKPYMKWVVIPEGLRKEEIADLLARSLGWSATQKSKWITTYTALKYDYIEGVYFPDTYLIPVDETPQAVANRLTAKFEEKFAPYSEEFAAKGIQWTTAIRMASVVQREAANNADMPLIAGIIWNRLLIDTKLQIDATVQYVRGNTPTGWWAPIKVEDLKIDSRYNTYLYKGLPPHPISNPGLSAIEATLNPAETECLFYIHDKDKQTHCAKTYEEHQQNIVKYLQQ